MNKLTFDDIDRLVELSQKSLEGRFLELGNEKGEPYYRFLYHLVSMLQPNLSLEIGVGWGLGSAHMCVAASPIDAEHHGVIGIDISRSVLIQGLNSFYKNYHFIRLDSTDIKTMGTVDHLFGRYGPLGIVFQDSSHHYEESCKEWEIYSRFLDDNAIWICDDITPAFQRPGLDTGSMVDYFEQLPGEKKLYGNLHHGSVMGVILT